MAFIFPWCHTDEWTALQQSRHVCIHLVQRTLCGRTPTIFYIEVACMECIFWVPALISVTSRRLPFPQQLSVCQWKLQVLVQQIVINDCGVFLFPRRDPETYYSQPSPELRSGGWPTAQPLLCLQSEGAKWWRMGSRERRRDNYWVTSGPAQPSESCPR